MRNKTKRLLTIRKLIESELISSQEELLFRLKEMNVEATQSTLSRDLKFMKVAKEISPSVASIGRFTRSKDVLIEENGVLSRFNLIENDRINNSQSYVKKLVHLLNVSEITHHE